MRERKPFFSIKRFPLPHTPTPSKRTTRDFASLWTLGRLVDSDSLGLLLSCWMMSGMALRAFRGYVVTERSRSNVIEIDDRY